MLFEVGVIPRFYIGGFSSRLREHAAHLREAKASRRAAPMGVEEKERGQKER